MKSESNVDFTGGTFPTLTFDDVLTADREYILIVKNDYRLEVAGGTNSGTKTFIKRNFFTSSEGVTLDVESLDPGKIFLTMNQ